MKVMPASTTLAVTCCALITATSAAPAGAATPTALPSSTSSYTLAAAFDPISYLVELGSAAEAVTADVAYWQTPGFALLVLSARVDPTTGEYTAVERVNLTSANLQQLVVAATAIPGVATAPLVQQLVDGIDSAGDAVADTTATIVEALEPQLAPFVYVLDVVSTGQDAYYAITGLPVDLATAVWNGQNPQDTLDDVAAAINTFVQTVANVPGLTSTASTAHDLAAPESFAAPETFSASAQLDEPTSQPATPTVARQSNVAKDAAAPTQPYEPSGGDPNEVSPPAAEPDDPSGDTANIAGDTDTASTTEAASDTDTDDAPKKKPRHASSSTAKTADSEQSADDEPAAERPGRHRKEDKDTAADKQPTERTAQADTERKADKDNDDKADNASKDSKSDSSGGADE